MKRFMFTLCLTTVCLLFTACSPRTKDEATAGQNITGQNVAEQNATGQNVTGQNAAGQNVTGQNTAEQNATRQNTAEQNATGQNAAGQNVTGQNTAEQNATGQNVTGQNVTGQNVTGQNVTGQNVTGQNVTGQNTAGQDGTVDSKQGQTKPENPGSEAPIPKNLRGITGRYLKSVSGDGILVSDTLGPVVFSDTKADSGFIRSLEDGDLITILVDLIQETYPSMAESYGCELVEKGTPEDVDPFVLGRMVEMGQVKSRDLTPMVFIDDTLYASTGRKASVTCGTADGTITSSVEKSAIPAENNQSNFGVGASFTRLEDGAVGVAMDSDYILFLDSETVEYHHEYYKKSELSEETLEWLKHYNRLPEEQQRAINSVPREFIHTAPKDVVALETDAELSPEE